MSFENFPYSNFHELNLDWIVQKLKEAYSAENPPDFPVKSVNGMTGDVIIAIPSNFVQSVNGETGDVVLYRNPLTQFPATDEVRWNLFRICDGTETGIEFDENGASRIEGIRRIRIYDEDNPPDYPVTSVNGQTGDVQITAGVQSVNGKTGNVVTPFVNPNTDILTLDSNSPSILWGISRNVPGGNVALYITTGGANPQAFIRYIPDGGQAINLPLLTTADIPEESGVVSVNTKSGVVTLYGTDILLNNSSNQSLATAIEQRINEISLINADISTLIERLGKSTPPTGLIENGGLASTTGLPSPNDNFCRTINFIDRNCLKIRGEQEFLKFNPYAYNKTDGTFVGRLWRDGTFKPEYNQYQLKYFNTEIDMLSLFNEYPNYDFKIIMTVAQSAGSEWGPTTTEDLTNLEFIYSWPEINADNITNLQTIVSTHTQEITALQSADRTHDQQISALQSANTTHDQQISTLQSADITHAQQISELYTKIGTGIKEATISEVVTLPARYPATGLDNDIKSTSKCMLMELSRPGVQHSNWTIETFDGYLTITGTIRGLTDITLYLI